MWFYSPTLKKLMKKWPGEKYLGLYRFLPIYFALGAVIEFTMINWQVGEVNFYKVWVKRQAEEYALKKLNLSARIEEQLKNRDIIRR